MLQKYEILAILFCLGFIVFDILTGLIKGVLTKTFSSKTLRTGLQNKTGFILVLCLAVGIEVCCKYVKLGIEPPAVVAICSYLILTEIASIMENIFVLSPTLKESKIGKILVQIQTKE